MKPSVARLKTALEARNVDSNLVAKIVKRATSAGRMTMESLKKALVHYSGSEAEVAQIMAEAKGAEQNLEVGRTASAEDAPADQGDANANEGDAAAEPGSADDAPAEGADGDAADEDQGDDESDDEDDEDKDESDDDDGDGGDDEDRDTRGSDSAQAKTS